MTFGVLRHDTKEMYCIIRNHTRVHKSRQTKRNAAHIQEAADVAKRKEKKKNESIYVSVTSSTGSVLRPSKLFIPPSVLLWSAAL